MKKSGKKECVKHKACHMASKICIVLFDLGCTLLIGFVRFATAGAPRVSGAPPPLTALNLLDRPRGTACSARNYLAVPNLRPPRRGVVQTKTMVLYRLLWPKKTTHRVCVFFALNRSFFPSTSSTTSVRADSTSRQLLNN